MSNTLISIRICVHSIFKGSLIWVSDRHEDTAWINLSQNFIFIENNPTQRASDRRMTETF